LPNENSQMHVVDTAKARELATSAQEAGAAVLCEACAYPLDADGACPRCALRDEVAALRRVIHAALGPREFVARLFWLDDKTY
jgi:hypothetical protein